MGEMKNIVRDKVLLEDEEIWFLKGLLKHLKLLKWTSNAWLPIFYPQSHYLSQTSLGVREAGPAMHLSI